MRLSLVVLILFASNENIVLASEDAPSLTPAYDLSTLPVSTLDLTLTGTILGTNKLALISVNGRKDIPFGINQTILDEVVLINVYPHAAVIKRNGQLEKLGLKKGAESETNENPIKHSNPSANVVKAKENTVPSKNNNASTARYKFLGKPFAPADVFTQAKVISETDGLQIVETEPDGVYEYIGLQSGDKIVDVNGEPITSLLDALNSIQKNGDTQKATTTLIRDGNFYNLEIDSEKGVESTLIADPEQIKQ